MISVNSSGLQNTKYYTEMLKTQADKSIIEDKTSEIIDKIKDGENETSYQTGSSSMTQSEWKNMLKKVDNSIIEMKENLKIKEEQAKKQQEEKNKLKKIEGKKEKLKEIDEKNREENEELNDRIEENEEKKDNELQEITDKMLSELFKDRD